MESFTKKEGLSSNKILSHHVDSLGIIWLGTSKGVCAYTGEEWVQIREIDDRVSGQNKTFGEVEVIWEDKSHNIWVSSKGGLFLFTGTYWINFVNPDEKNLLHRNFIRTAVAGYGYVMSVLRNLKM